VQLTPDGERLFQRCQRVLVEVEDLQAEAAGSRAAPAGTLRINLPVYYGKRFVLPLLANLARKFPALRLDIRLSDRWVDLVQEGVDLAVRMGALADCASASYLAAHGAPRRIEDLAGHAAIAFRLPTTGRIRPWQFRQRGTPVELAPPAQVHINDTETLVVALKLGMGLCQLPDNLVQDELASGELVEVLPGSRPEAMPINVVYPSGRLLPARVRAAIDSLEGLRRRPKQRAA
jgi:DNA-binding transcriptional LysR family regulator